MKAPLVFTECFRSLIAFLWFMQDTNVLGFKGPRKMTVLIPGMTHNEKRVQIIPHDNTDTMLGKCEFIVFVYFMVGNFSPFIWWGDFFF